ncbi:MAG: M23 family metallopeptidase [Limnohabitans sp.]|nr:M23 family metallopeptidase [Limnohabitans sp.]
MKTKTILKKGSFILLSIFTIGFLIPENFTMPVQGANSKSYNPESFWYYPWGQSGTHKGVDIFAKEGTLIHSATNGIVLFCGKNKLGGNVVFILGPKWRIHYYAHLQSIQTSSFSITSPKTPIGTVGTSGNAIGKTPHLHYTISTIVPYVWRRDNSPQGYKKMFYLNPIDFLKNTK